MLQTEIKEYIAAAAKALRRPNLYPEARVVVLCKEEDEKDLAALPEIDVAIGYRRSNLLKKTYQTIRDFEPEIVSGVFSGRPVFRTAKLLFLSLVDRPRLAFNASLDCYWVTPRTVPRLSRGGALRFGLDQPRPPEVVIVQTEGLPYVREVVKKVRSPKFNPGARVVVLAQQQDCAAIQQIEGVDEVVAWRKSSDFWSLRRQLKRRHPDAVFALFTGRPGHRLRKLFFLLFPGSAKGVFNPGLDAYWLSLGTLKNLFRQEPVLFAQTSQKKETQILLLQTEGWRSTEAAARKLGSRKLFPGSEITVFCKAEDEPHLAKSPYVSRLLFYSKPGLQGARTDLRRIRKLEPDVLSAVMSGRRVYPTARTIFLASRAASKLVFNGRLDAYWLSLGTLRNLFRREPLLFAEQGQRRRVVLLQTESWRNVAAAAERLNSEKLFPQAEVIVFCEEGDAPQLRACSQVTQVIPFSGSRPHEIARDLRRIRGIRPDAISAIFSSRRSFPAAKLIFLASRRTAKLVFNGRLDCYWLRLQNLPWLLRREPLLFGVAGRAASSDVLLIQTEEHTSTLRALERMVEEGAVPSKKVAVFCSRKERVHFENHPYVDRIFPYQKGQLRDTLSLLWRLRRERWDVVVGLFVSRKVYRLQKLLFLLLPARHRLAFNPNLDCFYLKRNRLSRALRAPSLYVPGGSSGAAGEILRKLIRGILFLPRFVFLMSWLSLMKLRRARSLLG